MFYLYSLKVVIVFHANSACHLTRPPSQCYPIRPPNVSIIKLIHVTKVKNNKSTWVATPNALKNKHTHHADRYVLINEVWHIFYIFIHVISHANWCFIISALTIKTVKQLTESSTIHSIFWQQHSNKNQYKS